MGILESITLAHLEDVTTSTAVDHCVSKLERKLGIREPAVGLPKLTGHFIMRDEPWLAMKTALIDEPEEKKESSQRLMVLSGMGGIGKTQLARKFAREYRNRYEHICFVDGSSTDSIEADLVTYVLSLRCEHAQTSLRQALRWFVKTPGWLIVFDNVDKPFDLRPFLPQCDHGTILVTTRNKSHGQLSPANHHELKAMSIGEAVKALLSAALPAGSTPSPVDREHAQTIVLELGCLPVAIIQAGSFILQRNCLPEYLTRLRSSRADILSRAAVYQRDEHCNSVYAVLETTRSELSEKAQKCLHLLSYLHYTNIPHSMILFAAQYSFASEVDSYLERPNESSKAIELLIDVLGKVDVEELDELLISLQNYSLVEIDRISDQRVLRLHPMVQAWAQDALKFEDPRTYRDAAVRLLSGCAGKNTKDIHRFILPHIRELSPHWSSLHPNDKAAFAELLWQFSPESAVRLWNEVHKQVRISTKTDELANAQLLLKLGKGYFHAGPLAQAELMDKQALDIRARILGATHLDTIKAQAHLALVYFAMGQYLDAEKLQVEVLRLRREALGEENLETIAAAAKLAMTLGALGRLTEATSMQEDVLRRRLERLKAEHPDTMTSMSNLARTYTSLGRHADAEQLRVQVLELRRKVLGDDHIDTIISSENLAVTYCSQKRYREARVLQEAVLHSYESIFEPGYVQTALGMSHLASTYYELGMIAEAEELARRAEEAQRHVLKPEHVNYKQTMAILHKIRRRRQWRLVIMLCFLLACFACVLRCLRFIL